MVRLAWCLVVLAAVGLALAVLAHPATAQQEAAGGEYPDVTGLAPFSVESNYMSLPGYLRWQTYLEQKVWLSMPEAKRIVAEQTGR